MAKLRWGLWVGLLVLAGLFVVQNGTPVLSLQLFGSATLALPLGAWVLGAIAAGFFTSLVLQALANVGRRQPRSAPRAIGRDRADEPDPEPLGSAQRDDSPLDWEQPLQREWEAEPEDGWNIEEPPAEPTPVDREPSRTVQTRARTVSETPTGDRGPGPGNRVSTAGDRGPTVGDRGPSPGDRVSTVGDRGPSPSDRGPTVGDRGPEREPVNRDTVNRRPVRAPARDEVYDANFRVLYPPQYDLPDDEFDDSDEFDDENYDDNWIDDDERNYR